MVKIKTLEEITPMGQVRLSKTILAAVGIKPGDSVVFYKCADGNIQITKAPVGSASSNSKTAPTQ